MQNLSSLSRYTYRLAFFFEYVIRIKNIFVVIKTVSDFLLFEGVNFINVFTRSFYARRSKSAKKDSQLKQLFVLLGSAGIKAALKHVDEIDPWVKKDKFEMFEIQERNETKF